ncbi:MAG: hypothetical protein Kow0025_12040 [Thermodesulfovibrionales bacterium]
MEENDGAVPPCRQGGCWIPPVAPEGARALELRRRVAALGSLLGAEAVLRAFGATETDLELLAAVEDELRKEADAHTKG